MEDKDSQYQAWSLDRIVSTMLYGAGIALFFIFVYRLSAYLAPFFVAFLVAYILDPVADRIQKLVRNRTVAVILTLLLVVLLHSLVIVLVYPSIQREYQHAIVLIDQADLMTRMMEIIPPEVMLYLESLWEDAGLSSFLTNENINKYGDSLVDAGLKLITGTFNVMTGIFSLVAFCLYLIFLLIYFDKMFANWRDYIPKLYRQPVSRLVLDIEKQMQSYFRGQTLIVLCVSVLFAVGFKIIGLPLGIMLGIIVGLMNFVPYLQIFGFIPASLLGLISYVESGDPLYWILLKIFLVFTVVQLIEDLFLTPKIMGEATGLNPVVILLSLSVWGGLFGVVGMIIALPMTSLLITYYKLFVLDNYQKMGSVVSPSPPSAPTDSEAAGQPNSE